MKTEDFLVSKRLLSFIAREMHCLILQCSLPVKGTTVAYKITWLISITSLERLKKNTKRIRQSVTSE